jgi:CIC family chloride channel protein
MGLSGLALVTGFGAGIGAIIFRGLIAWATLIFTGQSAYGATTRPIHPAFPELGIWFIVAVPAIGGLLYGPLIDRFAREARGHGVPEVMLAVSEEGGRIRPRVAVVKSIASAVCLGAGGSVGREGPIVQIGSALGSGLGQALRLSEANLRLLVACGAAGGISATFNAPIAGVFFALELILRDFGVRSFGSVVLASVTAAVVGRAAWGSGSFLPLPPFQIVSPLEYPLYALLGVAAALVGVTFIRTLYGTEDLLDRLWGSRPEWLRPVAGGVALGLLLLALPQLYGVGYGPLEQAIGGHVGLAFLLVLLVGKLLATSLTIGIGGSGGVFAPSLFLGGMLGAAFGAVANAVAPGLVAPAGAYGLVGMGAVFAGAARAPITAVLILFELTGDYQIILPMMLAIAVAAGLSGLVSADTIYTLKLRRRGIDITRERAASVMELLTVREAMSPLPPPIAAETPIGDVVDRLATQGSQGLPVVDADGRYVGILKPQEVEDALRAHDLERPAGELAESPAPVKSDARLEEALQLLMAQDVDGLPVVEPGEGHVIGWLTHQDVLSTYVARSPGRRGALALARKPPSRAMPDAGEAGLAWLRNHRIVDLDFDAKSDLVGRRLGELPWPAFALPVAVLREGRRFWPASDTTIEGGDRLTVLVASAEAHDLIDRLTLPAPVGADSAGAEDEGSRDRA